MNDKLPISMIKVSNRAGVGRATSHSSRPEVPRAVGFYSPGWPPGRVQNGIVTYIGQIAPALSKLGVATHIFSPSAVSSEPGLPAVDLDQRPTPMMRRVIFRVLRRIPLFPQAPLALAWKLARSVNELESHRGLDLLEMEESFGTAWFLQELISVPVVVRLHGPWFVNGAALGLPLDAEFRRRDEVERRCILGADGVTSPSRDILERVRRQYGVTLPSAAVIPNSAPRVPPERRWTLRACDRNSLLFVGRFDRHKGGDIVIDAFRELAMTLPDVELTFVGPDRGFRDEQGNVHDIRAYVERQIPLALRARLHVTGPLAAEQIDELRQRAFVTMVASRYENFSLALLESLAHGCPTIASDTGGNPEILADGRTGLLFEAGSPSALVAKVLEMFRSPDRAAEFGRLGADDMATRLSPESVARATLDYYQSVWKDGPRRRRNPGARLRRGLFQLSGII